MQVNFEKTNNREVSYPVLSIFLFSETVKEIIISHLMIHDLYLILAASTGAPVRQSRHRHTFYRQPSCTFSYYGRVGSHRYRYRRANAAFLIKPSRSMNDLYEVEARHRRRSRQRNRNRSGNTNSSSGDTESEEGEVRIYNFSFNPVSFFW